MTGTDLVERQLHVPIARRGAQSDVILSDEHLANGIKSKRFAIS